MNSKHKEYPLSFGFGKITKKIIFLFGLIFAQISNFVFWLEDAIPIEEFFIFDLFLIFSLFIVIFKEYGVIRNDAKWINYTCLLGTLNNFMITFFFLSWGILFPEKDMAFVHKLGLNGNFQTLFDIISLVTLYFLCKKYKNRVGGLKRGQVLLYEVFLIIGLACTLLVF